jgi:hypothetical protein
LGDGGVLIPSGPPSELELGNYNEGENNDKTMKKMKKYNVKYWKKNGKTMENLKRILKM